MEKERRLTGSKRFSMIYRQGRAFANRLLVLRTIPNDLDGSRFGFLVGKRIGGAVVRNKVKRRLREAVRLIPVRAGWDVIFIARREAANSDYHHLGRAAADLLKRSKLLSTPSGPLATPSTGQASRGYHLAGAAPAEPQRRLAPPPSVLEAES